MLRPSQDCADGYGTAIVFITHDLGVIAQVARHVVVMYLGRVMEQGPVDDIFHAPKHPYTQKLMANVLGLKKIEFAEFGPDKGPSSTGCIYSKVCPSVFEKCTNVPQMYEVESGTQAACFLYEKD